MRKSWHAAATTPDHGEGLAHFARAPVEARLRPQSEDRFHADEGAARKQGHQHGAADHGMAHGIADHRPAVRPLPHLHAAPPALLHEQRQRDDAEEGERSADEHRRLESGMAAFGMRQQAAERGADDEADVERGPQQRHAARALLGRRHVGDVALDHRAVAAGKPAQDAHEERHIHVRRQCHGDVAQAIAEHRPHQHRLAADAVRQPPPERLAEEGADGIGREHQRDLPGRGVERLGVEGQQRHHDAEAQQVDEHDRQQRGQRHRPRRFLAV